MIMVLKKTPFCGLQIMYNKPVFFLNFIPTNYYFSKETIIFKV